MLFLLAAIHRLVAQKARREKKKKMKKKKTQVFSCSRAT